LRANNITPQGFASRKKTDSDFMSRLPDTPRMQESGDVMGYRLATKQAWPAALKELQSDCAAALSGNPATRVRK